MKKKDRKRINRENGGKSGGKKTIEGLANSSLNALKHGARSKMMILPEESVSEFMEHCWVYVEGHAPYDSLELDIILKIASTSWRSDRLAAYECKAYKLLNDYPGEFCPELSRISLYESRFERNNERRLKEFRRLRSERESGRRPSAPNPLSREDIERALREMISKAHPNIFPGIESGEWAVHEPPDVVHEPPIQSIESEQKTTPNSSQTDTENNAETQSPQGSQPQFGSFVQNDLNDQKEGEKVEKKVEKVEENSSISSDKEEMMKAFHQVDQKMQKLEQEHRNDMEMSLEGEKKAETDSEHPQDSDTDKKEGDQ